MGDTRQQHTVGPEDRLIAALGSVRALTAWRGPDGPMLASAAADGTIRRWDAGTGSTVGDPMTGHTGPVYALTAWRGPDGPMLASAGEDGMIRRWDAGTGRQVGDPMTSQTGPVRALTAWMGPDGPMLASAGEDGKIRRWDAGTGRPVGDPMTSHTGPVRALTAWMGPGGPMLASAGEDGMIRRWDAGTGRQVDALMTGDTHWMLALTAWMGPDGPMLASAGEDGMIRRWDAGTGRPVDALMTGDTHWMLALTAWRGPDGPMLASAGEDGMIRRWDAGTGRPVGALMTGHTGPVYALTAWRGPDGPMLASAGEDGMIRRWDAGTGSPVGDPMIGHTRPVTALVSWISPDGYAMAASASDDGTIRRWNGAAGTPVGNPLTGTSVLTAWTGSDGRTLLASASYDAIICWDATAGALVRTLVETPISPYRRLFRFRRAPRHMPQNSVAVLTAWMGPDGPMLASAGEDGKIRRWDAGTGRPVGDPMTGHTGPVRALTAWMGPGSPVLASAGEDGEIRRWDAGTGRQVGDPMTSQTGPVRALTAWMGPDGPMLASAGEDGMIRRWDAGTGRQVGALMTGHTGPIRALTAWMGPGGPVLASAGEDGKIRRWDADTGSTVGDPMTSHTGPVRALTAWRGPDGPVLASAGADGTIRVWDANTGELLHHVLVEPIRLRGLADRPAARDLLDRGALTQALANLLIWRPTAAGEETGPSVVTIEGPWGTGKTTVMRLVKARITAKPECPSAHRHMSVAAARKILRQPESPADPSMTVSPMEYQGALTAWFNPWVYQSSEQVWAGLARSITDAAQPVLCPAEAEAVAHRYWLTRNAQRIDRFAVDRSLLLRVVSPLLGLSAVTALATILISLAKLDSNTLFRIAQQRVTLSTLALAIAVVFLLAGILDTFIRYYGAASRFLPGDLIRGPVLSGSLSENAAEIVNLRDPVYRAKSGYLHLVQEDTATTIRDLRSKGYDLVVFIDDLDRCSPHTTAEVFEAINLFLSGATELEAKFVIGLDPAVVSAHLDALYKDLDSTHLLQYGDDPSPGWAFLRKVVQLPVSAPQATDSAIDKFLGGALGVAPETVRRFAKTTGMNEGSDTGKRVIGSPQLPSADSGQLSSAAHAAEKTQPRKGSLERQPEILALIRERLTAQPERSAREAKRLLNVWQLYQRVLDLVAPLSEDAAVIQRACHLVILAEIVTRWPAMQPRLHQSLDGQRGLQILAAACRDQGDWEKALNATGLDAKEYSGAVKNLRILLCKYEGVAVADLAALVL